MTLPKGNPIPAFPTLLEMLRSWAGRMETRALYTFLVDGDSQEKTYTYRDLEIQARRIGAFLQQAKLKGKGPCSSMSRGWNTSALSLVVCFRVILRCLLILPILIVWLEPCPG